MSSWIRFGSMTVMGVRARSEDCRSSCSASAPGRTERYARPDAVQYIGSRLPIGMCIRNRLWLGNLATNTMSVPSGSDRLTDSPVARLRSTRCCCRLLDEAVAGEIGVGDSERAWRQHPTGAAPIAAQISQHLECMDAALRRRLGDAGRFGGLRQFEHPAPLAERLEDGKRFLRRVVEERVVDGRLPAGGGRGSCRATAPAIFSPRGSWQS